MKSCKLMTYNIRHGTDAHDNHTLPECAQTIINTHSDIVALQEVDRNWGDRSRNEDQIARMSELTGLPHSCFAAALANTRTPAGFYGNAILSRYPIERTENHALPRCPGREERRAIEAAIKINHTLVTVFSTHLCLDKNTSAKQLATIIKLAATRVGPVMIMGDFNAGPDDSPMRPVFDVENCPFKDVEWTLYRRHTSTYAAEKPVKKIDYILANKAALERISELRVIKCPASDHLPVTTGIGVPG